MELYSEFRDMPELKLNDVKVYVEEQEIKGQLILSRRKAKLMDVGITFKRHLIMIPLYLVL